MFDANLIAPLVKLLSAAEYDIKKEAAWAISNATSGGTADQIRQLVRRRRRRGRGGKDTMGGRGQEGEERQGERKKPWQVS